MTKTKLACPITGISYSPRDAYLKNKIKEYGSAELLAENFISKKALTYLKKGYTVSEIRSILEIDIVKNKLPDADDPIITGAMSHHNISGSEMSDRISEITQFNVDESSPAVTRFMQYL